MYPLRGLNCRVLVPDRVSWERDHSSVCLEHLMAMPPGELAAVDPLAMNLIVAKGIPTLASINIAHYQGIINGWVKDFTTRCLPCWEPYFYEAPQDFRDDIRYFRLGMVCQYLDVEVGIAYNHHQRDAQPIDYTNPSDLFLNGVLDTGEGTCGNMAALHVAFGWRMGWPVSLACVSSHFILRYDDGEIIHNIEATQTGSGGFGSSPDKDLVKRYQLSSAALESGSDLRILRPHEMLGAFVGLRARHLLDVGRDDGHESMILESERDWLLARYLFPANRLLYKQQMVVSSIRGESLFEVGETGHPSTYSACLDDIQSCRANGWRLGQDPSPPQPAPPQSVDHLFSTLG